jgi:peroxiredoxin Q/BCP
MVLSKGSPAPDFTLSDETGATKRLSDFKGRPVVLYFYPKDDTPGCTTEACNFRDEYSAYVDADVVILGVSPDSPSSHAKFKEKYSIPFPLLADVGHKVCDQYGVWGPKNFMGREYEGVLRTTFLVDANGRIAKVFENVKPAEHSTEVLAALNKLKMKN